MSVNTTLHGQDSYEEDLRPLIVMGSSSSEMFDYIFGDNDLYFPYWASSWSARSFNRDETISYVKSILGKSSRESNIILNFGPQDIMFSLPVLLEIEGFYDLSLFQRNTVNGFNAAANLLRSMGFNRIFSVFSSPITNLPREYWDRFNLTAIPAIMQARMYCDLPSMIDHHIQTVIDLHDQLSQGKKRPFLKDEFRKDPMDHHPDYIKIQDILWNRLKDIPGILPRREPHFTELYPHKFYGIGNLIKEQKTRPRTCR